MAHIPVDLDALTVAEQLDLLERIWERLSRDPANLPLTAEQVRELDDRDDDLEADIDAGRPLGEPWSEVRKRFK
jgi:putative addiction module component (TIGR02574 family)